MTRLDDEGESERLWAQPRMTEHLNDATEALASASSLWGALADDNDPAVASALAPGLRTALFQFSGGWAERLRTLLTLSRDDCSRMGLSTTVRVTRCGALMVLSVRQGPALGMEIRKEAGLELTRPLVLVPGGGSWQVAAAYDENDPNLDLVGLVDVVPGGGPRA